MSGARLILAVKVAVTGLLVGLILWNVNWTEMARTLPKVRVGLVLLVVGCMILNILVSSYKWKILLAIHGVRFRFAPLARYYFAGSFFNNFLPTNIGGDGYRVFKTAQASGSRSRALAAVLADRVTGILALLVVGLVGGLATSLRTGDEVAKISVVAGAAALTALLVGLPFLRRDSAIGLWLQKRRSLDKVLILFDRIDDYRLHPGRASAVAAVALVFHLFLLSYRCLLVLAVGAFCPPDAMAVVVAVSTLVALIPVSLNGYGLMDGSYLVLLRHFGVGAEEAVLVTILIRLLQLPVSLIGGLFYLTDPGRPASPGPDSRTR
jgi:uncharacterized membrane protein YbhN (UPF0104 family)